MHTYYVYDENGNIIRENWRNTTRNTSGSSLYTYIQNADGTTSVRRMAEGEATSGNEFIFDANGWCTESVYYISGDPDEMFTEDNKESRTTYEYDEAGRLIRTTHESLKYSVGNYIKEYSYDESNRLISRIQKDFNTGEVVNSFTISYSEDGMSIQTAYNGVPTDSYTRKDSLYIGVLANTIYTHDERGGRWMTYFYEYDENGVLTSISYKNINNIVPVEYFIGMGHLMEEFVNHDSLTFKPLSLVLEEQSAN